MAYGDPKFTFHSAGSASTASRGRHVFFGSYSGLSLLNENEVVHIQLYTSGIDDFYIGPSGTVTNNFGMRIFNTLSMVDLKPMRVGDASMLEAVRRQGNDAPSYLNASWNWVVWLRA